MWVEELANGKFKYCERYLDEKTGKTKKVTITLTSNSAQATKKAQQTLVKKIQKKTSSSIIAYPSFEIAYKEFLEFKKKRLKVSSIQYIESAYLHLADLNEYLINKITLKDVQQIIDKAQYDNGFSQQYTRSIKNLILAVIGRYNISHGTNLNLDLSEIEFKPKVKSTKLMYIDSKVLSKQIKKMYKVMPEIQAQMMEVQLLTGMRFAELAALTKNDWDGEHIKINKAIETANKRKVGRPKTFSSTRVIDSNNKINEIFKNRIKYNDIVFGENSSLIFANQRNRPMLNYYINSKLKAVHPEYSTHIMRHTHISLLAEKGLPLKYIMNRVGHSDPKTTLKIYTHVTDNMKNKGKKVLDNLY